MTSPDLLGYGLLLLAAVLMLLELKTAGFGALGIGGVVALVAGLWLLLGASPFALPVLVGVAVPLIAIFAFLAVLAHRARRNKVVTGEAGMIGLEGKAETDLVPEGKVLVRGELWEAWSPIRLERGAPVRVIGVHGLRLEVSAASALGVGAPRSIVGVEEDE